MPAAAAARNSPAPHLRIAFISSVTRIAFLNLSRAMFPSIFHAHCFLESFTRNVPFHLSRALLS